MRYLIQDGFSGILLIRRYICKGCGHTVSLLPSFAHPGRAYGVKVIVHVLDRYYATGKRMCEIAATGVCSRQLLRWFRIRIRENLNMLVMEFTKIMTLRAPPVTAGPIGKRTGQFFECIRSFTAEDISLKIFERTGKTYLSPLSR